MTGYVNPNVLVSAGWVFEHLSAPDLHIIPPCRIGERSSLTWFVLRDLMDYANVRNYDGSWTNWGDVVGLSVENPSLEERRRCHPVPPRAIPSRNR